MSKMKVVPQITTFVVLLILGGLAYYYSEAFRNLTDDIMDYAGITQTPSLTDAMPVESPPDQRQLPSATIPPHAVIADTPASIDQPGYIGDQAAITPMPNPELSSDSAAITPMSNPELSNDLATIPPMPIVSDPGLAENNLAREMPDPKESRSAPGAQQSDPSKYQTRQPGPLSGLAKARAAWHQGEPRLAIERYQSLMQTYTDHPDFSGELGNIYFSLGEVDLAVDAYLETVIRLLNQGDIIGAGRMHEVVFYLNPYRAQQFSQQFSQQ